MSIKKFTYGSLAAALLAGVTISASAAPIINFDNPAGGGTVSYNGDDNGINNDGRAKGENLEITTIFGSDTPQNSGQSNALDCDCVLNFQTGEVLQEGSEDGSTNDQYVFGSDGSFFTITGTVSGGTSITGGGPLVDGVFTGQPSVTSGSDNSLTFRGEGNDTKNPALLEYFGFEPGTDFTFANTEISLKQATFNDEDPGIVGDGKQEGSFDAETTSNSVDNTSSDVAAVPEPQELGMLLFGFALLGLGVMFRRKNGFDNQA